MVRRCSEFGHHCFRFNRISILLIVGITHAFASGNLSEAPLLTALQRCCQPSFGFSNAFNEALTNIIRGFTLASDTLLLIENLLGR